MKRHRPAVIVILVAVASLACGAVFWRRARSNITALPAPSVTAQRDASGGCTQGTLLAETLQTVRAGTASKSPSPSRRKSAVKPGARTIPKAEVSAATASGSATQVLDADDAAALEHARRLQNEGKFEQAKAAFIQATGRGETVNLRSLSEYAYAMLLENDENAFDDVENMLLTSTADSDPQLQAQAWFNLALLYRKKNALEAERAALARSLARREHPVVRAKLNSRSACVAEIGPLHVKTDVELAVGWKGVCTRLGLCSKREYLSKKQARARACVTSPLSAGEPNKSHGCTDDGPWESTYGYSMYRYNKAWIAAMPSSRFVIVKSGEGGWPAICQGSSTTSCEQSGKYLVVTQRDGPMSGLPGRPTPQSGERDAVCLQAPELTTTAVYSTQSTKLLAAVTVVSGHAVSMSLDAIGRRLKLYGGGCNGYVPLDGSMQLVAPQGS